MPASNIKIKDEKKGLWWLFEVCASNIMCTSTKNANYFME